MIRHLEPPSRRVTVWVVSLNVVITVLTAQVVGPAPAKLEGMFGLVGWKARLPFYLLPLYLAPLVLWSRPSRAVGAIAGLALAVPLALWAAATACPIGVQTTYLASGLVQGALLSRLARMGPGHSV